MGLYTTGLMAANPGIGIHHNYLVSGIKAGLDL